MTKWGDSIVGGERRKINHTHKRVTIFKNKNERDTPTHTHIHTQSRERDISILSQQRK